MKIKVHTSFVGKTGYNAHARDFFTALSKLVKLKIRNFTCGESWQGLNEDPHKGETYMTEYQKHLIGEQTVINSEGNLYDVEIYDGLSDIEDYDIDLVLNETNHHYFYDFSKFKGKFKIAYNVWESTRQPQQYFDALLKFDQFWVPTEWQKKVSIEQGYPADRVFVVPEAVESKIFFPDKNKRILDEYKDNRFKFLVFGRWDYRKSTKELIDTFLKTFTSSEPVDLVLSIENPYAVDGMKSTEERLNKYGFNDPRLKILEFPPREEYIDYLKNGHVFLSCARSEGWNLPLIEAFACGIPAIYSNWGAQLQFAEGKGHPVKVLGEKPLDNTQTYGLGKESKDGSHGVNSEVDAPGNYCEPDFNDLSKVMRDVYINYWEYKGKALRDSEEIRKEFSWENAALKAKKILDDVYTNLYGDNSPEPTKIAPETISDTTIKSDATIQSDADAMKIALASDDNQKPFISVVTSFYNAEKYVDEAIQSVMNQTLINWEYIVTDDFSTDNTKEKVLEWAKKDKRIKYVEQKEKQDLYWNPHKYANSEYVVIFDADDTLVPKALKILKHMFDNNPEVVLIDSNSKHYNEEIKPENFVKPRYCKKYKFFQNYLSYHKYYVNNKDYRFGETWGGLRSFRNILPKDYDFKEDLDLKLGKHEDLTRFLKFEELGKVMYIGRILNNVRDRKDSNSKKQGLEFDKIWKGVEERRKNVILQEPTVEKKYEKIWEYLYSTYYSDLDQSPDDKKISIIGSEFTDDEKKLVKEVYFDHDIIFDKIEPDVQYYFINFYNFDTIKDLFEKIRRVEHFYDVKISIQSQIWEAEPHLFDEGSKFRKYLGEISSFTWYNYANSYFYANLTLNEREDKFMWLTGGDEKYMPVVEKCVKSMSMHSEYPIIVYGFNCDVPFDYPNMIKRRIDIDRIHKFEDRDTRPYYYKIDASLECINTDSSTTYVWIDGDCVVDKNIDSIFDYKVLLENYPLCMRYKHENLIHKRKTQNGWGERGHGDELGTLFNTKRNNNFTVATGLYMFDILSKPFFGEVLWQHRFFLENVNAMNCVDDMALSEERLFNVLFWKYNYKKYLPITWISNAYYKYESGNEFIPKIENYIKSGFDIMFDYSGTDPLKNNLEDQSKILFYHGQRDISKVDELMSKLETNKLMIVAHPDDETIFGGAKLINEDGWKVVVVTDGSGDNNDAEVRRKEFETVMNRLNIHDYKILGFKDDMNNILYDETEVEVKLREIINEKKWKKIITHNEDGEYGHIVHKSIHNIVKRINPSNLEFFSKSDKKLALSLLKQKNYILDLYESQNTELKSFKDFITYEEIEHIEMDKNIITKDPNIIFNFDNNTAFVEIKDDIEGSYNVKFIDNLNNNVIYNVDLNNNNWAGTNKQEEQIKWRITITDNQDNIIIFQHVFDMRNQNVKFKIEGGVEKLKEELKTISILIDKYNINPFIYTEHLNLRFDYPNMNFVDESFGMNFYSSYEIKENDKLSKIFKKWIE